jgi:restriction system protein
MSNGEEKGQPVPATPDVLASEAEGLVDISHAARANYHRLEEQRRMSLLTLFNQGNEEFVPPPANFGVLVSQAVITPFARTSEGELIRAVTIPLRAIIEGIMKDPSLMYGIDPRKWEEIIAATYEESGQFDEVTLTPQSGDYGRDVIAVKNGFGSVRLIESVKRYKPGNAVKADDVRALLGVLSGDPKATKGVSTTWEFAPRIADDPFIAQFVPYRLELLDGTELVKRIKLFTDPKGK